MCLFILFVVLACLLNTSMQRSTPSDSSYVAAVVEYQPQNTTSANLENYLQLIQQAAAQDADIVVFPELTLTRESVEVPMGSLLQEYPIPYEQPNLYDSVLVTLSQAASQNQIYIVVNFEEVMDCYNPRGEYCPTNETYRFNTNVVFDRNGTVIDRYRKINLFGERTRTPALRPDLGIFTTDFGVRFGHFICFDLMFQVPAFQVVEHNITNVIFTTMWFSEMPYLTAVQIQEAYAFALNINFLASGANNVGIGSAGSGIYSGKAGALGSTMPGVPTTRLLVARVPKVPGQVTGPIPGPTYDPPSDHDSLYLITDPSLPAHVTRPLVPGSQEFTLTDKEVSCTFRVNLTENQPASSIGKYNYRAAAFSGIRSFTGVATGGNRICSVFACTGPTIDTCGKRFPAYHPKTTAIFDELTIVATVPTPVMEPEVQAKNSGYFPVSLMSSIMPLEPEYYSYSEDTRGNITVYTLTLNNMEAELYTLAVWGRYFATDGQEADPPRDQPVAGDSDGEPGAAAMHCLSGILLAVVLMRAFH